MFTLEDIAELNALANDFIPPVDWFETEDPPEYTPYRGGVNSLVAKSAYELDKVARKWSAGSVIIWNSNKESQRGREYVLLHSYSACEEFVLGHLPAERTWHEKITSDVTKIFFDIDDKNRRLTREYIRDRLIPYIQYAIYTLTDEMIVDSNFTITDSTGAGKQSLHIIVQGYCVSKKLNCQIAEATRERMGDLADCIDTHVYVKNSGLRLPWCTKDSEYRPKRLPAGTSFADCLITNVENCIRLTARGGDKKLRARKTADVVPGEVADILGTISRAVPGCLAGMTFRNINGNIINMNRTVESACPISGEVHQHDNTVFIIVGNGTVTVKCRHCKRDCITVEYARADVGMAGMGKVEGVAAEGAGADDTRKKKIPLAEIAAEVVVAPVMLHNNKVEIGPDDVYQDCDTVFDRRPMGAGKTQTVKRTLVGMKAAAKLRGLSRSVLAVSFRKSFTEGIITEMRSAGINITSYREVRGPIVLDRDFIVQCESLPRVKLTSIPNVLILDEVESIIKQMFASTHKRQVEAMRVLLQLIRHCPRVWCIDANLSQWMIDFIHTLRGTGSVLYVNAQVSGRVNIAHHFVSTHHISRDYSAGFTRVRECLAAGEVPVVVTNSCKTAKTVAEMVRRDYPSKRVGLYTSEGHSSPMTDVAEEWSQWDILIYTPTILAGVSYTRVRYTTAICFWNDRTTDVYSSIQMLRRVRSILSKGESVYYHYFKENARAEVGDDYVYSHIQGALRGLDGFAEARPEVLFNEQFQLYTYVKLTEERSRADFLRLFVRELKLLGAVIIAGADEAVVNSPVVRQIRLLAAEIDRETAEKIAAAEEIVDYEDDNAKEREGVEFHAGKKLQLRRFYRYDGPISAEWVIKYSSRRVICQYLRRKRLVKFEDTPEDVIGVLIRGFFVDAADGIEVRHLRALFDIARDKYAADLLKIFGLELGSARVLPRAEVVKALETAHGWLVTHCDFICRVFDTDIAKISDVKDKNYVSDTLKFINGKLDNQYGVKINSTNGMRSKYKLVDSFATMFDQNFNILDYGGFSDD